MRMSGMPGDVARSGRKAYAKPVVKQVQLRPEEAVLGNCKGNEPRGPATSNCNVPSQCYSLGS